MQNAVKAWSALLTTARSRPVLRSRCSGVHCRCGSRGGDPADTVVIAYCLQLPAHRTTCLVIWSCFLHLRVFSGYQARAAKPWHQIGMSPASPSMLDGILPCINALRASFQECLSGMPQQQWIVNGLYSADTIQFFPTHMITDICNTPHNYQFSKIKWSSHTIKMVLTSSLKAC